MDGLLRAAPELPTDLPWLQTPAPLTLRGALRGHVVVLLFWNSVDVHSRHALEDATWLAHRFAARPLAVVTIHVPKFPGQRGTAHVEDRIARLGLGLPVLVDDDWRVWQAHGCGAWPTTVLIDVDGDVRYRGAGEIDRPRMLRAITTLLAEESDRGLRVETPWSPPWPESTTPAEGLAWPAGLTLDPRRGWLWIADTGHHRIVAVDRDSGAVRRVVGCGEPGDTDGSSADAAFAHPGGLVVVGDEIWVADTGNHLVRAIAPEADTVRTVLGRTRRLADLHGGAAGPQQGLSAPTDLAVLDGVVYLIVAGCQQVWTVDPSTAVASPFAGNGRCEHHDGESWAACFAQPCGIAAGAGTLAVVDVQSSALRRVDAGRGVVATLLGGDLTRCGVADGAFAEALLQAPHGVAAAPAGWLIADTLNDAVRLVDTAAGRVRTLLRGTAGLRAPQAVAADEHAVFVASTGCHRILRVDPDGNNVQTMSIEGLPHWRGAVERVGPVELASDRTVTLRVPWPRPAETRLHPDVPVRAHLETIGGQPIVEAGARPARMEGDTVVVSCPTVQPGTGEVRLRIARMICRDPDGVCHLQRLERRATVTLAEGAPDQVRV